MPISKIKPLPKKVYDKIAAGEVIDRPSSILRELLDNSIDSGATEIIIHLSDGGNETIQIIDNGCGMNESDVRICCEPFTTSKIENSRIYSILIHMDSEAKL
jgi:DNA mismatch repair protein MutL